MSAILSCHGCGARNRIGAVPRGTPRCARCKTALPWIVTAGEADFAAEIVSSVPVVVDFWAPWCGPCRHVAPVLETLAAERAGRLKVLKVNVDENPALARRYRAMSIPLLVVFRAGVEADRAAGALPKAQIEALIDRTNDG